MLQSTALRIISSTLSSVSFSPEVVITLRLGRTGETVSMKFGSRMCVAQCVPDISLDSPSQSSRFIRRKPSSIFIRRKPSSIFIRRIPSSRFIHWRIDCVRLCTPVLPVVDDIVIQLQLLKLVILQLSLHVQSDLRVVHARSTEPWILAALKRRFFLFAPEIS